MLSRHTDPEEYVPITNLGDIFQNNFLFFLTLLFLNNIRKSESFKLLKVETKYKNIKVLFKVLGYSINKPLTMAGQSTRENSLSWLAANGFYTVPIETEVALKGSARGKPP